MPILERTPPPKKAGGISPSPLPEAHEAPQSQLAAPVASSSSLALPESTPSQRAAAASSSAMSEFPSLEDMARPHLLNRAVQEASARPTPVRSASVRTMPSSASRSNLSRIAGPTSGLPQPTGAAAVSASLPRPSPGRAGALYPAVGAAAKRAGDLTSRASRTSLTGLDAVRARTEGTPAAVAAALAQRDSTGSKATEDEEAEAMSAVATASIDVEARNEPAARLCSPVVEALVAEGTPKGASPRRTPLRAARLSGATGSVARQGKASPRSTPRRAARRSSQLASAVKPAASSGADEEFVRRLEAAMQAGDNPFADKRKADMRKSVGHPSVPENDVSGFGAASSSTQQPSEWESRLDAALQAGDDPFKRRSNLRDEEQDASVASAVSTPRARKAESDLPAAAAQASHHEEVQAEDPQGDRTGPVWPSAHPVIASLAASRDGGRSSPISFSQQRPVPSSPVKVSQTSFASSPHRLDPSARAERVVNLEIAELKKAHAALASELQLMQREADAAREDADGWKAECEGETAARAELASEIDVLKAAHAKERRKREAAELQVLEARCEADEREWARLTGADATQGGKEALRDANIELVVCRNEATYQTYRGHELTRALDQANAELKAYAQQARVAAQEGSKARDAELEELRQKLQDEKERRKNVAREGMRVEEERDAALEELEALKKRQDKAASSASSEALKRAEARAEREEEKRKQLEKEVRELKRITGRSVPSPAPVRRAAPVVPAPAPHKRKETTSAPDSDAEPAFSLAGARKPVLPKARSALTRAPMQGASDAAPPPSDADFEIRDDDAGTPSPAKRPGTIKSLAVVKKTKAPAVVAAPRYAPTYRDAGSDSEDNASDYDVGKAKTRTVGAAAKARSTVKPLSGAAHTVARKRKSVEADEARRKALEAEVMATPMVKAPVRTLKVAPHNVVAAGAAAKPAAAKAAAAEPVDLKKKKRRLLGAAGAQGPGFFKFTSTDGDAISSGLDLPMDLSPIKAANPHAMRPAAAKSGAPFAR